MRKQITSQRPQQVSAAEQSWLDLSQLAEVELTSEDAAYPIEAALLPGTGSGWRAARSITLAHPA